MQQAINTENRQFCLYITIKCVGKRVFRCIASDYGRANSKYADRAITVDGERTIYFSLPLTPKTMNLEVFDVNDKNAIDFSVSLSEQPLKTYAIWLDEDSREFLNLCLFFSQVAGFNSVNGAPPASPNGRMFATSDNKFAIKYFDVIKDFMTNMTLSTPARIGHTSGIIETSAVKFRPYTLAMRVMILLHEFSHKYRNPKMGLAINNEIGADINALYIYLGLGFSKVDAIYVYANVFLKAQTPGNIKRMRKIVDYIQRFENEEFAKLN